MKKLRSLVPIALFALAIPTGAFAAPIESALGSDSTDWWDVEFGPGGGSVKILAYQEMWNAQLFIFLYGLTGAPTSGVLAQDVIPAAQPHIAGLGAGRYWVAVSKGNQDPVDSDGDLIFPDVAGLTGPNPGAGHFAGWAEPYYGLLEGAAYSITFTGTTRDPINGNSVPEPGTLLLMGTGLAALARRLRRRPVPMIA